MNGIIRLLFPPAIALAEVPALAQRDVAYIAAENALTADDERAMQQVIVRLNHALDAADYSLYTSFFAEDSKFVSDFGTATGREAIAAALEKLRPFITGKRHVAANYLFAGDDKTATVATYLIVFERETSLSFVGSAVNVDTFAKRGVACVLIRHDSKLDPATQAAMMAAMSAGSKR